MAVRFSPNFARRAISIARACALIAVLGGHISAAPFVAAAPTSQPVAATSAITATKTDSLLIDANNNGRPDSGDTLRYTVTVSNTGTMDATNVTLNDTVDPNTSLVTNSEQVSPLAFDDAFSVLRDTPLVITAPGLLTNDTGTALAATAGTKPTTAGGSVTINTNGSFSYTPPAGYTGADSFSYAASNALGSDTATVRITAEGAPRVVSTTPANNAVDFPANANLTVTFDEPVTPNAGAFTLACPTVQPLNVSPTGPATTFTLDPVNTLPETANCTLTVVAANISDADQLDPPDQMAADVVISFTTTDAAPEVSSITPADGAANVAGDTNISVVFSESVSTATGAFALACDGTPQPLAVSASPATTFTLDPTANLAASASCTLTIDASKISDSDLIDPPDTMLADVTSAFTIDAAPRVVSTAPANNATGQSTAASIVVNFSESVNASTGSFSLQCNNVAQVFTLSASPASSFTLTPNSPLPTGASCTVSVIAAQISDADANDPPDTMAADYSSSFSTDATPTVTGTTPTNGATTGTTTNVVINFSESVNATTSDFTFECNSVARLFTLSASPASSFTLTPNTALPAASSCTVTAKAQISDADSNDPPDTMVADYVFSFNTDVAPTVTSTTPPNGASNLPSNTAITVNFSEAVNVTTSSFTLVCGGMTQVFTLLPASPAISFTLTPTGDLGASKSCTVTVVGDEVHDVDSYDPPDTMVNNFSFSFSTDAAPEMTGISPATGTVDVLLDSNIVVSFSESVVASASSFSLVCDSVNRSFTLSASPASIFTLDPTGSLPTNKSCTVTVIAANISDADANDPPDTMVSDVASTFQTIDDAAPTVTSTTPADTATNVATNTNVTVNFSEQVNVANGAFSLVCNGVTQPFTSSASPASSFTLDPTSDLPLNKLCTVTVAAASVTDVDAIDPPDVIVADYSFSFTTDDAPTVASTTPANNAANLAIDTNLSITFSEPVNVSGAWFSIACPTSGARAVADTIVSGGPTVYTINPNSDFAADENCTVTVVAAQISDVDAGDPPDTMLANYLWSFTTDAAPEVSSTTPTNGASNLATDTNLSITFSEPVNVSGNWFSIACPTSGPRAVADTAVSGGPTVYTINPTTDFAAGENCTVTVVAAQVSDVDAGDPPDTMAANYMWNFTTDAAPDVSSTTPTNGALNQATTTDVTITFSEAVNVSGNWFSITCPTSGARSVADTVVSGGPIIYTINPTSDFAAGENCTVTVAAALVSDADAGDPPDIMAANYVWSFATDAAPAVTSTVPANLDSGVATDVNIVVNFSESVNATISAFSLTCNSLPYLFTLSASPNSSFTLNPNTNLPIGTNCSVLVSAAQVNDVDANDPPDTMAASYSFSFATDDAPTVASTTPADTAANLVTNTDLTITFSEPVNVSGAWFSMACPSSGPRAVADTVVSGGPTTYTINPNSDFAAGETCTVTVAAAQVSDVDAGDPPDTMLANYVWSFSTEAAPTVTSTTPTNAATTVGTSTNIIVNFSESVNTATNAFTLVCNSVAQPFTLSASPAASFTLDPNSDLPENKTCTVTVIAANVSDEDSIDPPDTMAANYVWSFTTDAAPTVTSTTPTNNAINVTTSSTVVVNFSESVSATTGSFSFTCGGSAQAFTLSASPASSFTLTPASALPAGETCTVTVLASQISDTDAGDPPDTMAANYLWSFGVAPLANTDSYNASGNIAISVAAPGVLANDIGSGAAVDRVQNLAINVGTATATTGGGSVTLNADGSFNYDPPTGVTGTTDTFTYRISSGTGNSNTATVTITLSDIMWFICNACGGTNQGTLLNPFTSIGAFSTANTGAVPAPQDSQKIYLRSDTYSVAGSTLTLRNGQLVYGQGTAASSVLTPAANTAAAFAALTAGTRPVIAPSGASGVVLAQNNTLQHFDVGDTGATGTDITGNTFGTLTINNVSLLGTGRALDLNTGTLNATFDTVTSTSSSNYGVALQSVAGTSNLGSGSISNSPTAGFYLNGGTGSITYGGTIGAAGAVNPIVVQNKTGGTVTLSGAISSTGKGIDLTGNTGATINFTGDLNLGTGANIAFKASGGGTISATNANSTVTTTTATAVDIQNTTIGAAGVTFKSIAVNGAGTGILLNNTGSGGFNVTGTGSTAGSGGTIQNITNRGASFISASNISLKNMAFTNAGTTNGADPTNAASTCGGLDTGSNTGCNAAVHLNTVTGVALENLSISGGAQQGINARQVTNFSLKNSSLTTIGNETRESGLNAYNLLGTVTLDNADFSGSSENNITLYNASGTANITINNGGTLDTAVIGSGALIQSTGSANVTLTVTGTQINANYSGGLVIQSDNTSTLSATLNTNTITNNYDGIEVTQQSGSTVTYSINGNTISNDSLGINANMNTTSTAAGRLSGTIAGNTITTGLGNNIQVMAKGQGTHTTLVQNNTLTHNGLQNGIRAQNSEGSARLNATILNNTVATNTSASHAIIVQSGSLTGDTGQVCADLRGNSATNIEAFSYGIRVWARKATVTNLVQGASASTVPGTVLQNNNPSASPYLASTADTGVINVVVPGCAQPLMAAGGAGPGAAAITQAQLDTAAVAARAILAATDLTNAQRVKLDHTLVTLSDLATGQLGGSVGTLVTIDRDGAGWGWNVGATTGHTHMDLQTVVMHELGHVLGYNHADNANDLMSEQLTTGEQRQPTAPAVAGTLTLNLGTLPAGKQIVITFDVVINDPLPAGTTQISNQASITADGLAPVLTDDPATPAANDPTVTELLSFVFLPLIANADTRLPDLVVERIVVSGGNVSVVIRNQGGAPVTEAFWVDTYINPRSAPTGVNQVWQQLGDQGLVWGVRGAALPLAAGASLTLTIGDLYYNAAESKFSNVAAGTPIYAQVDSANINTTYGAVLETHERDGGTYNNISRIVSAAQVVVATTSETTRASVGSEMPPRK